MDSLGRALVRAACDADFRLHVLDDSRAVLAAYQRCMGADVLGLAAFLDCPPAQLPRFVLARRPDPHRPGFLSELARVAARTGVAEGRPAAVLQYWQS